MLIKANSSSLPDWVETGALAMELLALGELAETLASSPRVWLFPRALTGKVDRSEISAANRHRLAGRGKAIAALGGGDSIRSVI